MITNLFVLKENRYSYSPIISIADFFSSKIEIVYLKDFPLKEDQKYEEKEILSFIENQLKDFKISEELNLFLFSIHSWYRKFFLILLKYLKDKFTDSLFVAGGPDVIANPVLYANYFDLVCKSEGESFLIDFYYLISNFDDSYEKGYELSPINISNCISKFSSIKIVKKFLKIFVERKLSENIVESKIDNTRNARNFLKNYYIKYSNNLLILKNEELDNLIDKIENIKTQNDIFSFFPSFPLISSFFHPIEITRGCPQGCKYCQTSNIFGRKTRKKDLEVLKLFLRYQIVNKKNHIRFISPDFALYFGKDEKTNFVGQWEDLIDFIKKEGLNNDLDTFVYLGSFPSELSLKYLDYEYLNLISKYSATRKITIGIQTASKRLQNIIGRNDPLDILDDILKYSLNKGLEPIIDIIFGLPFEDEEDRDITINFLEKNCNKIISANIHYFLPIPGTEFANCEPTKLSNSQILRIKKLMSKGVVSGNFFRQMNEFKQRIEIPLQYLQNL
ncbi:MAG: radical SAM protein [Spirochaetota bacterium]